MENEFEILISQCKKSILESDYETAEKHINEAFSLNNNSPKVHNLLGIIAEIKWDRELAIQHYRASLALDSSYRPAIRNLEKITTYGYFFNFNSVTKTNKS